MSRSIRSTLPLALALSLTALACGGSDSDTEETNNDATGTNATGGEDMGAGGGGSSGANGTNGGNGTNGSTGTDNNGTTGTDACTPPGQQCTCTNGQMGFQACNNGTLGECTCSLDLSDAGLPPPSECPATATCQGTMGAIMGLDGFCAPSAGGDGGMGMNGGGFPGLNFPPMCTSQDDCNNAGLPDAVCQNLMLPIVGAQQLCVQPCVP